MPVVERIITFTLIAAAASFGFVSWRKASLTHADNEQLRAKVTALESELADARKSGISEAEIQEYKKRSAELMKLRNEVTQLRGASQNAQNLATENDRLKAQLQQARASSAADGSAPNGGPANQTFPRDQWHFAGYATPQSALVSAIWAMREGNPDVYLQSLAPAEQQRTAQNWQSMSQDLVVAKQKNDVANISSIRVLEEQKLAPDEIVMSVYLEGAGRMEKVRLNQVGQEWKFSGFVRPQQPAAQPAVPVPVPQ